MKKLVLCLLTLLLLSLLFIGTAMAEGYTQHAVIDGQSADRVHLRAGASTMYDSLGLYFTGTPVEVLGGTGDWTQVRIGSVQGYILSRYLRFGNDGYGVTSQQPLGLINNPGGAFVNLRPDPSEAGHVLAVVNNGAMVTIAGETADHWYYVFDEASGQWGYMMASLVLPMEKGYHDSYIYVLKNVNPFIVIEEGKPRVLRPNDLRAGSEGLPLTIPAFSRIDLDGDGRIEVVLQLEAEFGPYGVAVIFQPENGSMFGQIFGLRALGGLKFDGSYSYSSSAMESGIGRLRFDGTACIQTEITYSAPISYDNPTEIVYFVNNLPSSQAGFEAAVRQWTAQREAVWVPME
ncbi:MAG: SH3 domain-containing protein [Oscillospiraceae bacterium]|jgi:SH3-like domain-containing protein|nr:SH3 domain-containing protein [Oscillospiraceae bacterium]